MKFTAKTIFQSLGFSAVALLGMSCTTIEDPYAYDGYGSDNSYGSPAGNQYGYGQAPAPGPAPYGAPAPYQQQQQAPYYQGQQPYPQQQGYPQPASGYTGGYQQPSYPQNGGYQSYPTHSPAPAPAPAPAPSSSYGGSHTVLKGETLWGISQKYGTSVTAIQGANGIGGTQIFPGDVLQIP